MRKVMLSLIGAAGLCSVASADTCCEANLPGPLLAAVVHQATAPAGPAPAWMSGRQRAGLRPAHEAALAFLRSVPAASGAKSLCFAPDAEQVVVEAFTAALDAHNARANPIDHWTTTATDGGGLQEGEPLTLTYSFVPDGTFVPNINGFQGNSDLRAYLDGIYGSQAAWQPVFDQVFARWAEVSGINYVYEPNDDGATLNQNNGVLGVRGDLRIAGIFLDGPSNILAYNNFPNDGDMVFDTGDTFYTNTGGNSIRLRNVASHEHGHGMGLAHVCPIEQEKLMEPFVTTSFNGPQHDDIRGAQRLYGDPFEPDNSPAAAVDLGVLATGTIVEGLIPSPAVAFGAIRSIDDTGEEDWLRFTVASPARITVVLNPIGRNYDSSAQQCGGSPGSCCSGNFLDSRAASDLSVRVVQSDGVTVLNEADNGLAGFVEGISNLVLPSAGTYYIRVAGSGGLVDTQLYTLNITTELLSAIPLELSLPSGAPQALMPGAATPFSVMIVPNEESIVPGSAVLQYRFDAGAYISAPLVSQGGDLYTATIPAASCEDSVQFFVSVEGDETGVQTVPGAGAAAPFEPEVGTPAALASFDFETAPGWTAASFSDGLGVFAGGWDRGVPLDDSRGDPSADFDGSGQCWLTGNSNDEDIDNGETILMSPAYDLTGLRDVHVSYARWYSNTFGASPEQDTMIVEISDTDGATWTTLEVVGPTTASANGQVNGGWIFRSLPVDGLVDPTAGVRVRFRVADVSPGSVVEAGVDAFGVSGRICQDVVCACELDGAAGVDVFDLLAYLDLWFAADPGAEMDGAAGVDVFDLLAFLDCWFPASAGEC